MHTCHLWSLHSRFAIRKQRCWAKENINNTFSLLLRWKSDAVCFFNFLLFYTLSLRLLLHFGVLIFRSKFVHSKTKTKKKTVNCLCCVSTSGIISILSIYKLSKSIKFNTFLNSLTDLYATFLLGLFPFILSISGTVSLWIVLSSC